jgi:hypothetical protein
MSIVRGWAQPCTQTGTQESYRPRVSDRTMVGNSATSIAASSLRGLQGRSATGQNDQAAKETMSRRAGYRENTSGFRLNGEVFFA